MLTELPIAELKLTTMNPRKVRPSKEQDAQLLASIRRVGLINPITVKKNGKGYEIIAGSRRFKAAKDAGLNVIPVTIIEAEAAKSVALDENMQRAAMHPADEVLAFKAALASGCTTKKIANDYAVTEILVAQRLALANLAPKVIELWRKGEFDLAAVKALTNATPEQQKAICEGAVRDAYTIRRTLSAGGIHKSSRVGGFAGPEYEKRELPLTVDLFGEDTIYHDLAALNEIASELLIKKARGKYGKDVEILVQLDHFEYPKGYNHTSKDAEKVDKVLAGVGWDKKPSFIPLVKQEACKDAEPKRFSDAHMADIQAIRRKAWVEAVKDGKIDCVKIHAAMVDAMLKHEHLMGSELYRQHNRNQPRVEGKMPAAESLVAYAYDPNSAAAHLNGFRLRDYWSPNADFFARMKTPDILDLVTELIGVNPASELVPDPFKRDAKKMKKSDWCVFAAGIFAGNFHDHLDEAAVERIRNWEP